MQISLISYVKNCPHFEAARWSCASDNAEEKVGATNYNLTGKIDSIQEEHLRFMCELARTNNEVKLNIDLCETAVTEHVRVRIKIHTYSLFCNAVFVSLTFFCIAML